MRSSQFNGALPRKVTVYTTGTGMFTPLAGSTWRRETLVSAGGGGSGGSSNASGMGGSGGQAGSKREHWVANDGAPKAYAVGAKGLGGVSGGTGSAGGSTTLGASTVPGGFGALAVPSGTTPYSPAKCGQASPFGGYGQGGNGGYPNGPGQDGSGGFIMIEEY